MRSAALAALLAVAACAHPAREAGGAAGPELVAATVNGEPIVAPELTDLMARERAGVHAYFHQRYGAADGPAFWTTPHGGERPIQVLEQRALAAAVRIKVQQLWMREAGLLADPSYAGFLRSLDAENLRRRTALARGEVIYGPQQFGRREYLTYRLASGALALKAKLASDGPRSRDADATYRDELARRVAAAQVEVVPAALDRLEVQ